MIPLWCLSLYFLGALYQMCMNWDHENKEDTIIESFGLREIPYLFPQHRLLARAKGKVKGFSF